MMQHEDFMGNYGRLSKGDVQWMTAGRGVVHAEMPLVDPAHPVDAVALQLWLDLPAAKKMVKPSYKEKKADALARATFEGGSVVVVSGESHGAVGPIRPIAGCWFLDYTLNAGGETWQPIPEGWTAFVYVLEGVVAVGGQDDEVGVKEVGAQNVCVLSAAAGEEGVRLRSRSKAGTRFVLIAGEPLDQPMVLQGPFVSTSRDGAAQALRDYQSGRNGFEKALGWRSDIGKDVGMVRRKARPKGEEGWEERDPKEKGRAGRRREEKIEGEVSADAAGGKGGKAKGGSKGRKGKGGRE
jgi:redox-sensitive bicupin YhaK (pirin superfamily)